MPRMADPSQHQGIPYGAPPSTERCAQCQAVGVPLLSPDEPVGMAPTQESNKPRYCNTCMIGKKVQVFWPVDESWYTGTVYEYDPTSGEHLLRYEDGDAEWVRIAEPDDQQPQMPLEGVAPDTPSLETPQASPDRPPEGMPGQPPPHGVAYYTQHGVPVYSQQGTGGPPGSVPGVVYAMYSPPPHGQEYPPPREEHYGGPSALPSNETKKKTGPKAWTKEEDAKLLRLVQSMQMPMKWSVVAHNLPGRTGKQCRERYVNHLNPRLKVSDWNPVEDSTIFHLYSTTGSHWSSMSKVIPGRTDNGIKNRFHNLRRQVERDDESRSKKASFNKDLSEKIRTDLIRILPEHLQGKFDSLWAKDQGVPVMACETVESSEQDAKNYFGPFVESRDGQVCVRCGFIMPSVQTGRQVCEKTGWCLPCALLPPQLSGNLLRECLSLRREKVPEMRAVIEGWDFPTVEQREEGENATT